MSPPAGRVLRDLLAALVMLCGLTPPAAALAPPASAEFVQPHTYDAPQTPVPSTVSTTQRGPTATTYDYGAQRSVGNPGAVDTLTHAGTDQAGRAYTYDDRTKLAHVDSATSYTASVLLERLGDASGALSLPDGDEAAKTVPEALSFGSRATAREGLPGDLASVGNRFFRGATSKSQDFQAVGLPGGGYRLQFFSPANNPGYGKLYVQEIDRTGNILRRYKDTMGPDGFIERKVVQ